jgi:hypothetical protein
VSRGAAGAERSELALDDAEDGGTVVRGVAHLADTPLLDLLAAC